MKTVQKARIKSTRMMKWNGLGWGGFGWDWMEQNTGLCKCLILSTKTV